MPIVICGNNCGRKTDNEYGTCRPCVKLLCRPLDGIIQIEEVKQENKMLNEEQEDYLKEIQKWKRLYLIDKEIVEKIKKRMDEIVLDLDDTVDCYKIAKFVKELLEETNELSRKVWVLSEGYETGGAIVNIFDSVEKANNAMKKENYDDLYIREYDLE